MRDIATLTGGAALIAATQLTWLGLLGVAIFCVLVWDTRRRVQNVLKQMDGVIEEADRQGREITEIKSLLLTNGGDHVADGD